MIFRKIRHEALILIFIAVALAINKSNQCLSQPETETDQAGKTYFVDDDASPGGDGSMAHPFDTITNGLKATVYGDTLKVLPGVYNEMVVMKEGVVILGSGAKNTLVQYNPRYDPVKVSAVIIGANNGVLKGFTIIDLGAQDAVFCNKTSPTILDNIIINYVSNTTGPAGVCCRGPCNALIARNVISSFSVGLNCYDNFCTPVFRNNLIINQSPFCDAGIFITRHTAPIVRNNIISIQGYSGIFNSGLPETIISSNIIHNPGEYHDGIHADNQPWQTLYYNDIWVGGEPYIGCNPGIGDIQADPLFINPECGDFRLHPASPCIDAGDPNRNYNDLDGTRNDMGAFGGPDPISLSLTMKNFLAVSVSNVSGFPGDTVKVAVGVDNAARIAQAKFIVNFDSLLLCPVTVQKTVLTDKFELKYDLSRTGKASVILFHQREIDSGKGDLVYIMFKVNPDAQSQATSPLNLSSVAFQDSSGEEIDIKVINHGIFLVNYTSTSGHLIYVDAQNSGIEDGSRWHPFNTINEAVAQASDGDTIQVCGGIYDEVINIEQGIYLRGTGAQVTTIKLGKQSQQSNYVVKLSGNKPCGLSHFTIMNDCQGPSSTLVACFASRASICENHLLLVEPTPCTWLVNWEQAESGVFKGNKLEGGVENFRTSDCENVTINGNSFDSGSKGLTCISSFRSTMEIRANNFILRNSAQGVEASDSSQLVLHNNIFESIDNSQCTGLHFIASSGTVINNTLITGGFGMNADQSSFVQVMNNIIVKNSWRGLTARGGSQVISTYNNLWDNQTDYFGTAAGQGDIAVDPRFIDVLNHNFHLANGSPCIDAGNPDPAYSDLDGSRNDMGAFGGPLADTTGFLGRKIAVALVVPQNQSGDTLYIPVTATSVQGISNIEMKIEYNESHLILLAIRHGEITQPFSLSENYESPGITSLRLSSPLIIQQSSGSICELMAQVQTTNDTATVIRLNDLIFKDQVDNVYVATPVEGHITITAVKSENHGQNLVPDHFALLQNYPNPFNPTTVIRYNLPVTCFISLKIYNLLGQEIRVLCEGVESAGNHHFIWDGKDNHGIELPSGLYLCRLSFEGSRRLQTIKLVLIR